jgi:hypothetical protein
MGDDPSQAAPITIRHARACPGHPRLTALMGEDVDGRDKPGHDEETPRLI